MSHPEDGNFASDVSRLLRRRSVLGLIGLAGAGGAAAWLMTGGPGGAEANVVATGADGSVCIKPPGETAGPYPADGTNARAGQAVNALAQNGILRDDIRSSFAGQAGVAEGTPLTVEIQLVDVTKACAPLVGHALYLWHCDADGKYSLYDLPDANYLRGLAISDANGLVRFTTIFPGCYDGRWPHFHFEVFANAEAAVNGTQALLTSQFALPSDVSAKVYDLPRYATSKDNLTRQSLAGDNIFSDNTPEQMSVVMLNVTGDVAITLTARSIVGIA